jgi:dTDP-4-dehydrorhamnose 3,5-epimerase-like enzyme
MYSLLNFKVHGDHQGKLVALEKSSDFPFDIKRVYYIWDTAHDVIRGKHAHRKLEQVIICSAGSCDFILDNGKKRETVHLNNPSQGLYIKYNIWREFTNFSKDCVVTVLAFSDFCQTTKIGKLLDDIENIDKEYRGL